MLLSLALTLSLQATGQSTPPKPPAPFVRDSSRTDSVARNAPRRLAVTAPVLASAFKDSAARDLFYRAHRARMVQDSSLRSYDATVRRRISVGMRVGSIGPERVMYRQETASRVRWQQGVGARVELTGARTALPIAPAGEEHEDLISSLADGDLATVPYFPGYDALWIGGRAQDEADDRRLVNPLANGAEAYYTYESGDAIRSTLPNGMVLDLRELKVRPRSPKSNLAVGSLMFDNGSGQLVWAAYRLAAPADMWESLAQRADTNPAARRKIAVIKAIAPKVTSEISEVTVEYSLFDGRFWLPRSRSMKGFTQAAMMHVPISIEHTYRYTSVNGGESLAPIVTNTESFRTGVVAPDSITGAAADRWRDSVVKRNRAARTALRDTLDKVPCDAAGNRTLARERYEGLLLIAVTFPCDADKLVSSADFTTSIYEPNEEVFGSADREALLARALSLSAQAPFGLRSIPRLDYGLSLTRYNRIEGLSTGLRVEQQLGGGYSASVLGRFGFADHEPNVELSIARTNLSRTFTLTGYNRLVSASDWGQPLSFSASLSALMFGRDDGFYYRASGAELGFATELGAKLDWRIFAERQRTAAQETGFSIGGELGPNIVANAGTSAGAAVRFTHSHGLDPRGFRTFTDLRLEAAGGDSVYGRGAVDLTLSRGLFGDVAAALTLAGGTSVGGLPMQRHWFLGGTHTIRGESPDTAQSGNAFWMTRSELGRDFRAYRMSVFGDLGWVGDRTKLAQVGRPMSGVGVGFSVLDGLFRVDVARGLYPRRQFRVDASLGARW